MFVSSSASESTFRSCALNGVTLFVRRYPLHVPRNSQNTLSRILTNVLLRTRYTIENVANIRNALYRNTSGVPTI